MRILCSEVGEPPSIAHSCSCDSTGEEFVKKKGKHKRSQADESPRKRVFANPNNPLLCSTADHVLSSVVKMSVSKYRHCNLSPVTETLLFDQGLHMSNMRVTSLSVLCITCRGHSWSPIPLGCYPSQRNTMQMSACLRFKWVEGGVGWGGFPNTYFHVIPHKKSVIVILPVAV